MLKYLKQANKENYFIIVQVLTVTITWTSILIIFDIIFIYITFVQLFKRTYMYLVGTQTQFTVA